VETAEIAAPEVDARWDRLQAVLIALKPGETVRVDVLARHTGLERETIVIVLNELVRVLLFEPQGDVFVRRSLRRRS
jgi:hypothetical protein